MISKRSVTLHTALHSENVRAGSILVSLKLAFTDKIIKCFSATNLRKITLDTQIKILIK